MLFHFLLAPNGEGQIQMGQQKTKNTGGKNKLKISLTYKKQVKIMKYLAHSAYKDEKKNKDVPIQFYQDHIQGVFSKCQRYLSRLKKTCHPDIFKGIERIVLLAAEYHDMGKLDNQAQKILKGKKDEKLINHIDAGVAYLLSLYQKEQKLEYLAASYLIHAHHIGFCNFEDIIVKNRKRLKITYLPGKKLRDHKSCVKYHMKDIEVCQHVDNKLPLYIKRHNDSVSLIQPYSVNNKLIQLVISSFTIMKVALSILCDSDHEDTSLHYQEPYPYRQIPLNASKRLNVLLNEIKTFKPIAKGIL